MTSRPAIAAALVLALAACGSDSASEKAGEAAAEAVVASETPGPAATASDAPAAAATPAGEATASPTPTPTATATAARAAPTPAATPTTVAAAGPPDSFKQCAICHKVEPSKHGLGPSLANVFGARAAHAAGYNYSPAMKAADLSWNQGNLDRYLANPQAVVPGTTMAFAGVKDAAKRAEIIAYLKTL